MDIINILSAIAYLLLVSVALFLFIYYTFNYVFKGRLTKDQIINQEINKKLGIICEHIKKLEDENNADSNSDIYDI